MTNIELEQMAILKEHLKGIGDLSFYISNDFRIFLESYELGTMEIKIPKNEIELRVEQEMATYEGRDLVSFLVELNAVNHLEQALEEGQVSLVDIFSEYKERKVELPENFQKYYQNEVKENVILRKIMDCNSYLKALIPGETDYINAIEELKILGFNEDEALEAIENRFANFDYSGDPRALKNAVFDIKTENACQEIERIFGEEVKIDFDLLLKEDNFIYVNNSKLLRLASEAVNKHGSLEALGVSKNLKNVIRESLNTQYGLCVGESEDEALNDELKKIKSNTNQRRNK